MEQTTVGRVLSTVDQDNSEDFYKKYLHDFVRIVHACNHKDEESKNHEYEVTNELFDCFLKITFSLKVIRS